MSNDNPDKRRAGDPIEKLFRDGSEEYDIPFREEDWNRLEKDLDLIDARRLYRQRLTAVAAAALLLLSLLGYLTYDNYQRINDLQEILDSLITDVSPPLLPVPENPAGADLEPDIDSQDRTPTEEESDPRETDDRLIPVTTDELAEETGLEDVEPPYPSARITAAPFPDRLVRQLQITDPLTATNRILLRRPRPEPYHPTATQLAMQQHAPDSPQTDLESEPADLSSDQPRFAAGIAVSPDLSGAGGFGSTGQTGYKLGVSLEYRLSSRLSLSAGALFSRVHYRAPGDAYRPAEYWENGVRPDMITADCLILDIPLSLKVDVLSFERSRLFTSASISSYIMLNEEYEFQFLQAGPNQPSGWSGRSGTHWASSAGLSVGYELDVHRDWSIRAEPFVRMPVNGVGWGDVNLWSLGSFLSIQTRF